MDGARLSRFPHLSWLQFGVEGTDAPRRAVFQLNGSCHTMSLVVRERHDVRSITRGTEKRWTSHVGTVNFLPMDGEQHTFVTSQPPHFALRALCLPRGHLEDYLAADGHEPRFEWRPLLEPGDVVLRDCIQRLCDAGRQDDAGLDARADEAARRLILRLAELCGAGKPDWHRDAGVFDRRTLARLVEYVDGHLKNTPSLDDLSLRTGLSPSHFAKKFRQTTGLSLHRFVNRRRILRSLDVLQDRSQRLATVGLDLGFSSQSHFTRLFNSLTGMTPARYRRSVQPTLG